MNLVELFVCPPDQLDQRTKLINSLCESMEQLGMIEDREPVIRTYSTIVRTGRMIRVGNFSLNYDPVLRELLILEDGKIDR